MSNAFELRVVTPSALVVDESVDEVTAPGTSGEFGVLPNHITFLSSLEIGTLTYRKGGATHRVAIRGGFAEVVDNVMTVLADDAQAASEIDLEAARSEAQKGEAALKDKSPLDDDHEQLDSDHRWALARAVTATAASN